MKKIVMCIPTRNRPETVARVLKVGARIYSKYPIDIYYYDSSDHDETEQIVRKYLAQYENIHYIRMPSDMEGQRKMEMIYAGYGWTESYEYFWPVKDRVRFRESALDAVMDTIQNPVDVVFLGRSFRNRELFHPTASYDTTPVELYRDWGWMAASMEAVIFNRSSMLGEDFTVESCERECACDYNIYWLQQFWLFYRLSTLSDSNIRVLVGEEAAALDYQWGKSEWEQRVFKVWKEDWVRMNEGLPDIYDPYKSKVIREGASLSGILGSVKRVRELRDSGILTRDNLEEVLVDWEKVSDVPPAIVRDIVHGTDESHDVSILQGKRNDTADFIIRIIEMLREGSFEPAQVPFEKIAQYVQKEASLKPSFPVEEGVLLEGVLADMERCAADAEITSETMQSVLQCLLVIVSLLAK